MIRTSLIAAALLASGAAAAQTQATLADHWTSCSSAGMQEALPSCTRLLESDGVSDDWRSRAFAIRGEFRLRSGERDTAIADFNAALRVPGATVRTKSFARSYMAEALFRRGEKAEARREADLAVATDPSDPYALRVRAWLALQESRWADALADLDKAIAIRGDIAEAAFDHYRRGVALSGLKRPASEQIDAYSRAIALDPKQTDATYWRGVMLQDAKRYAEAERDFDIVVAQAPKYAEGYNSACWVRAAYLKHEFAKARTLCAQGIAIKEDANILDSAGLVALQQGRWQDGWTFYDRSVKADPKAASAIYGRGVAALRLGRTAQGKADIAAGIALDAGVAAKYESYGQAP